MSWPAVRTEPAHPTRSLAWAYLIGSGTMVAFVPLVAWLTVKALEWGLPPLPSPGALGQVGLIDSAIHVMVGILIFSVFSPPCSWIGLLVGIPLTIIALRAGLAGWLVAVTYFGLAALLINLGLAGVDLDSVEEPGWWLASATGAGAVLSAAFWLGMRMTTPHLFRSPRLPAGSG